MIAQNQRFQDMTVLIDGSTFVRCTFERCTIIYSGQLPVHLDGNRFTECKWDFAGPAKAALFFMSGLYSMGGDARNVVEQTFDAIRNKAMQGRKGGTDPIVLN